MCDVHSFHQRTLISILPQSPVDFPPIEAFSLQPHAKRIELVTDKRERVMELARVIPLLNDVERHRVLQECLERLPESEDGQKATVLDSLSPYLSGVALEYAITIAGGIVERKTRALALAPLVAQVVREFTNVEDRPLLLSRIGKWHFLLRELPCRELFFFCTSSLFEQSLLSENSFEEISRTIYEIAEEWNFSP